MVEVKRTVKLVTEQKVIDKPSGVENFPMRSWNIKVYLLDSDGNEVPANIFDKVTYKLHPTFKNHTQVFKTPPFKIQEEGWGEFEMEIILHAAEKGGDHAVPHDLNFLSEHYDAKHILTFKNPKPGLIALLRETGTVPGDENGNPLKKRAKHEDDGLKKRKRGGQNVDMEKLAEGLQKLKEDDLLQVVQMVHDNKTPESYTKNDVEQGEFHVDLYTLPDSLIRMLWDFTSSKVED